MIPAGSNLEKLLSVANYGNGLTLKDMEVKITPIRLSLSEKAYYLSIFLVLSNEERNFGYSVGYSTQGKCLHITKLSL